ncbi:flagellinolysin [Heliorestis convoluta]|uniref:Flagellin n=1 Tax=Heliorestis convoluta TaxID=356322 RepID=A0A5Q2N3J7_9FIRM|nr:flagellinolysin [Heliorestis convoluta]QGG48891.1 flagellin [Heliorestis convoluta]
MRINHNHNALNAFRQLGANNTIVQRSLEQLSSGLRINKAGDDAAGLAISEKMRAQIRGLNQASRSAQDAIAMIQTAEGALGETHNILQRMRELSVQAANDTYNVDRQAVQNEINQLTKEIDRIGNATEFNTIKLLNRSSVSQAEIDTMISNLKKWWLKEAEDLVSQAYGITASGVNMEVVIFDNRSHPAAALVRASFAADSGNTTGIPDITGKGSNLKLEINLAHARPVDGSTDGGTGPQYVSRVMAHEMVHAVMMTTMNFGDMSIWFQEGTAEFIHGHDEFLQWSIDSNGGGNAGLTKVVDNIGTGAYSDWNSTPLDYSTAYVATRYLDWQIRENGGQGIKDVMDLLKADDSRNLDQVFAMLNGTGKINFSNTTEWAAELRAEVRTLSDLLNKTGINLNDGDTGSIIGSSITGDPSDAKTAETILPQTVVVADLEQPLSGFNLTWPSSTELQNSELLMQIGANSGQSITIKFNDMRAAALGISDSGRGLDVLNHKKASHAITKYDEAITLVSAERSKLGAYQNRLEHTIKNLENTTENLHAAESRIRNVDMAKEIMNFTKMNILHQASQVMLSQANMRPQSVLQLLT